MDCVNQIGIPERVKCIGLYLFISLAIKISSAYFQQQRHNPIFISSGLSAHMFIFITRGFFSIFTAKRRFAAAF